MFEQDLEIFNLNQGSKEDTEMMPFLAVTDDEEPNKDETYGDKLPILPLKNTVLFPGVIIPIAIGRDKSHKAINRAQQLQRFVGVLTQKDSNIEDPTSADLHKVGTVAKLIKILNMPDGSLTAVLQGRQRFELGKVIHEEPFIEANISALSYKKIEGNLEYDAMIKSIHEKSKSIIELSNNIPNEAIFMLKNISSDSFLLNFISSNLNLGLDKKQELLEMTDLYEKANAILLQLNAELQLLEIKDQVEAKVRTEIEKQQRDFFLNQQLKTIQEELGGNPQEEEIKQLLQKSEHKKWSKEVKAHFDKEIKKLQRINPHAAEYAIQLNYLDILVELPWNEGTEDIFDLTKTKKVLDQDHHGLEKVKERILEHLAVLKLKGDMKAPILCLVGPPGVGKTSLGKSIARALGRKFQRMSLGGLHDEAEIRGHRKTYIGALPGRIVQALKKAQSANPVFILDEIDKIGKDFRGDPSSALLEVLDPEQNHMFYDNYLELEVDLSKILFIATANSLSSIQPALLDRMEIIEIPGYSLEEKIDIAKKHLLPEQLKEHGLKNNQIKLSNEILEKVIQEYTRESGVRSLNRQIAALMRRAAKQIAMKEIKQFVPKEDMLKDILGVERFNSDQYTEHQPPGVAIGLAWTRVGGDILFIETSTSKGKGKLTLTGNLGDVMKESASTALSFIKSNAEHLGINSEVFENTDLHVHVPEGAIPKDGPSAGITMLTAITSALKNKAVKPFVAMTGEITLRGKVLPVGGIKEKVLAAKRAGLKEIILCEDNRPHIEEINPDYIKGLQFHYVKTMDEVLKITLGLAEF